MITDEPVFPTRPLGTKNAKAWLAEHNPYMDGTFGYHDYARRFWDSQTRLNLRDVDLNLAKVRRRLIVAWSAIGFTVVCLVITVVNR